MKQSELRWGYCIAAAGLGIGSWRLDAGYWMIDGGYRIQDTGYRIQDAGCWIQDAGCRLKYCNVLRLEPHKHTALPKLSRRLLLQHFHLRMNIYPASASEASLHPVSWILDRERNDLSSSIFSLSLHHVNI
ncbi:MAG: hypothetical protein M0Q38_01970 [Bacteroidales bacterium]|nr:hypothetical protein [Bacteroidales bacterium]